MLGKPKYKRGDCVQFSFMREGKLVTKEGYVYIVDSYGTFFQTVEPSYDIMVEAENCLYKHIEESLVRKKD